MALTAEVKDELARVEAVRESARRAEVGALLRFAGALHLVAGRIVVEAEVGAGAVARRLHRMIGELYEVTPELTVLAPGGILDRVLTEDGFVDKLVAEGGTLDQVVALGSTLESIAPQLEQLAALVPALQESADTLNRAFGPLGTLAGRIPLRRGAVASG